jgi:hypothetical protein
LIVVSQDILDFIYAPKQHFNGHYEHGQLSEGTPIVRQAGEKGMSKFKCVKLEFTRKKSGLARLFLNKQKEVKYAKVRHCSHRDEISKKPQFTYCRLDLGELKTLLNSQGVSLSIGKAHRSPGQSQTGKTHDLELKE